MYKIRDWLYIGKYTQTRTRTYLDKLHIDAMLLLAEPIMHTGIESLYVAVEEGEAITHEALEQGIRFVRQQKAQGARVLIACGAGTNRSVIFAMGVLMEEEQPGLLAAYREVYTHHRAARPHHEACLALAAYFGQSMDLLDVWDGLQAVRKEVDQASLNHA